MDNYNKGYLLLSKLSAMHSSFILLKGFINLGTCVEFSLPLFQIIEISLECKIIRRIFFSNLIAVVIGTQVHICLLKGEKFPNLHGKIDVRELEFQILDAPSSFSICAMHCFYFSLHILKVCLVLLQVVWKRPWFCTEFTSLSSPKWLCSNYLFSGLYYVQLQTNFC